MTDPNPANHRTSAADPPSADRSRFFDSLPTPDYQRGDCYLYNADCLDLLPRLPEGCVDAVVTDPPFKLSQAYSANADPDNLAGVASIVQVAPHCRRICVAGGLAVVFYDTRILPFGLDAFRRAGWKYLRQLTLYRRWGNAHKLSGWMSTSDPALVMTKPGEAFKFNGPWAHDVYVRSSPESEDAGHPAQKPLEFFEQIVSNVSTQSVLDPYCGSGTTGVACVKLGRAFIGVEKEPKYFDIACNRIDAAHADQALFTPRPEPTE